MWYKNSRNTKSTKKIQHKVRKGNSCLPYFDELKLDTVKMKSDNSIRNICISAIKRHTIKPYDFSFTNFFEIEFLFDINQDILKTFNFTVTELPISQTFSDNKNWTLITTKQIISCIDNNTKSTYADKVVSWQWDDFKGYQNQKLTIGQLELGNGENIQVLIETGRASMVTIYSIMTLVGQVKN